jgi:hypothetical protein
MGVEPNATLTTTVTGFLPFRGAPVVPTTTSLLICPMPATAPFNRTATPAPAVSPGVPAVIYRLGILKVIVANFAEELAAGRLNVKPGIVANPGELVDATAVV